MGVIKEVGKVVCWLIITLNFTVISYSSFTPWANIQCLLVLLCSWVPFPSFLPQYFLFIVVFFSIDTLLVDSSFLPSSPETAFFSVMECLKQSQKTWLSEFTEQLWLCDVTSVSVFLQKAHCLWLNHALKRLIPDHTLTHMVIFYCRDAWRFPLLAERTCVMFYSYWFCHRNSDTPVSQTYFSIHIRGGIWTSSTGHIFYFCSSVFLQPDLIHNEWK